MQQWESLREQEIRHNRGLENAASGSPTHHSTDGTFKQKLKREFWKGNGVFDTNYVSELTVRLNNRTE